MPHRRPCPAAFQAPVVLALLAGAKPQAAMGREPQRAAAVWAAGQSSCRARAASMVAGPDPSRGPDPTRSAA